MKTDWGTARHKLRPTKIEIKAQVFDVWLEVDDSGIYRCQPNDNFEVDGERPANAKPKRTPVARQPFSVFAESVPADTIAEYGIIIRHRAPGGALRDLSLPASILESDARLWQTLAANGIRVKTSQTARQTVTEYLIEAEPESMIRVYGRPGWHTTPHGLAFVCGQEIIGDPGAMFQPSASAEQATAKTSKRSDLATWQTEIAERATASLVWEFELLIIRINTDHGDTRLRVYPINQAAGGQAAIVEGHGPGILRPGTKNGIDRAGWVHALR